MCQDHSYLLDPVSAGARLRRNRAGLPLRSLARPRLHIDIELDQFSVALSEGQYRGARALMDELDRWERARLYAGFRTGGETPGCNR